MRGTSPSSQLGRGSITAGVAAARDPEGTAAKELAAMLEVGRMGGKAWQRTGLHERRAVCGATLKPCAAAACGRAGPQDSAVRSPQRYSPLARRAQVRPAQVAAEARRVPESDLDIDTLFKSLLQAAGPSATTDSGAAGAAGSGAGGEATVDDCRELFE